MTTDERDRAIINICYDCELSQGNMASSILRVLNEFEAHAAVAALNRLCELLPRIEGMLTAGRWICAIDEGAAAQPAAPDQFSYEHKANAILKAGEAPAKPSGPKVRVRVFKNADGIFALHYEQGTWVDDMSAVEYSEQDIRESGWTELTDGIASDRLAAAERERDAFENAAAEEAGEVKQLQSELAEAREQLERGQSLREKDLRSERNKLAEQLAALREAVAKLHAHWHDGSLTLKHVERLGRATVLIDEAYDLSAAAASEKGGQQPLPDNDFTTPM